jgi:pimeloyl-ACP methyl ester carboxylesterase
METRFARSSDGTRIACDISGEGPALLLLHGLGGSRQMWHAAGVVEQLQAAFRVITLDLRGHGESGAPTEPAAYTVERHLQDLDAVAHACNVDRWTLWGWSFGATIGTHYAAHAGRLERAVLAGTYFGPIFTEAMLGPIIAEWEPILAAQAAGTLDEAILTPQQREMLAQPDLPVRFARLQGLLTWPAIAPSEIACPALVYVGTADERNYGPLREQQAAIEAAGLALVVFEGLDHQQLVTETGVVLPRIVPFLQETTE